MRRRPVLDSPPIGKMELAKLGISEGLVRLSAGLEGAEDLIADLDQALEEA